MTRFGLFLALPVAAAWVSQIEAQGPLFAPAPGSPFTVAEGPGQVVVADVNSDGHLDIVTSQGRSRTVTVLLGNGRGAFSSVSARPITFGYPPGEMDLGDVDNDRILDLGVTSHDSYNVEILLGDGEGGFKTASSSPFTASDGVRAHTHGFAFADVNKDLKLDILTANNHDNNISVLLGDGRGGFSRAPGSPFAVGPSPYPFGVGDVNGDGNLDVVTPNSGTGGAPRTGRTVTLLLGDGKGGFKEASGSPFSVPPKPYFVGLGDLNDDHRMDIATSHNDSDLLGILLNDGGGMFNPAPGSPYKLGSRPFELVVADVNRDMKMDLIAATGNSITVLLGNGHEFAAASGSPFPAGPGAWRLAIGDLNEDGKVDITTSNLEGNSLTVLLGN